jgi:tetratricopeptide (TPR) repeat protein
MAAADHPPIASRVFNPYVGPRPFREAEADRFYGRGVVTQDLLDAWLGERLTILHGPSAVGKTSLLNAGVLPKVSGQPNLVMLPVGALAGPSAVALGGNGYANSLLSSWARSGEADVLDTQISDFIRTRLSAFPDNDMDPVILASIDHFEGLFTAFPARPSERDEFVAQLTAAIRKIPALRLLLVINDEHLAGLHWYEQEISPFSPRYIRLDALAPEAALEAINYPLRGTSRSFGPSAAEELIDRLSVASRAADDPPCPTRGNRIEPLFLQLVCRDIWSSLAPSEKLITADHLRSFADIDQAISRFYDLAIETVSLVTSEPEEKLRTWIENNFITEYGTRNAACRGILTTAGLPNQVADAFTEVRVLVTEYRSRSTWYQLGHERMITSIQQANTAWQAAHGGHVTQLTRSVPPEELISAAAATLAAGNFSAAHGFAKKVSEYYRGTADLRRLGYALTLQASIANTEGDYQKAERYLQDALSKFAVLDDRELIARTLSALADVSFTDGDYNKAGELYVAAVDQLPTYIDAMIGLGFSEWYAGSPADAEATFALAQGQNVTSGRAAGGRGQVLAELSEYHRALVNLDAALESGLPFEEEVDTRSARALALSGVSRPEEADKELAAALRQAPDRARTHRRAGKIAAMRQQNDLAIVEFQLALEAKPPLPPWDEENARRYLAQLVELDVLWAAITSLGASPGASRSRRGPGRWHRGRCSSFPGSQGRSRGPRWGDVPPDHGPDGYQDQFAGLRHRIGHDAPLRRAGCRRRGACRQAPRRRRRVPHPGHRVTGGHDVGDRRVGFQAAAFPTPAQRSPLVDDDVADLPAPPDPGMRVPLTNRPHPMP